MPLTMDVSRDGRGWTHAATMNPGDPEGSISNSPPEGCRDVILFRCEPGRSVIRRSASGVDWESGDQRVITTTGFEELAELGPGDSFVLPVTSDRGLSYTVRWTHATMV